MNTTTPDLPAPLFLLAPPRTYSSVICAMLGGHPDLACLPETNLFAAERCAGLQRLYAVQPRFQHGLLRIIAQMQLGGQTEANIDQARAWLAARADTATADLFRTLMAWAAPRGVVEKSPIYALVPGAYERLRDNFPQARFLHVTRHPRTTCESIYRTRTTGHPQTAEEQARMRGGKDMGGKIGDDRDVTPENMWLKPHQRILEVLAQVPAERQLRVRGEDLLDDPTAHLPGICAWLGIRDDDQAVAAMLRPECSPYAGYGPDNAPMGNDRGFMEAPRLRPPERDDDLQRPLSWHEGLLFGDELRALAAYFGY